MDKAAAKNPMSNRYPATNSWPVLKAWMAKMMAANDNAIVMNITSYNSFIYNVFSLKRILKEIGL